MRSTILAAALVLAPLPAFAHDFWSTGEAVPNWVKSSCCGRADSHHLRPGAVHVMRDGYHIDGLKTVVPMSRALPSMDGSFWAFWSAAGEPEPVIFCFFAPLSGV